MFFDRGQNQRRQKQLIYRNDLKQQINLKNSKIMSRPQRSFNKQEQSFSLLKNIEIEEQNRRNKQSNYYAQLRNQIQQEKQQKKRKKQEEARKQREEQEKIKRDNEMLRQRAQMQKIQQGSKKRPQQTSNIPTNDRQTNRLNMQQSISMQKSRQNRKQNYSPPNDLSQNYYSRIRTSQSQKNGIQLLPLEGYQSIKNLQKKQGPYSMSQLPTYLNRVQNESFNFLPQRKYMDSYFQELLGQKRKFQQEANGIYELNRIFYHQRVSAGKIQSRGLSQLKKLQSMLDQKGADYMASYSNVKNYDQYNQYDSLKKLTVPSFQNSRLNQSGWRKLD